MNRSTSSSDRTNAFDCTAGQCPYSAAGAIDNDTPRRPAARRARSALSAVSSPTKPRRKNTMTMSRMHPCAIKRPLSEAREIVVHEDDDGRSEHRTGQRAQPAKQRHQDHFARHLPRHVGKGRELKDRGFQRAGETGHRSRQREREQLEFFRIEAQRFDPCFVVAYRLEHLPEWRVNDPVEAEDRRGRNSQNHVVVVEIAPHIDQAEQRRSRNSLHAVLAAGERRLQQDKIDELGEGERDHRELDALSPN